MPAVPPSRPTPWWGLASSLAAPVLLVGGWTWAASRQQGGFDPVVETISALAARDADDRWIMTAALLGLGACHLTTAAALRGAALPGRLVLGVGGVTTVLVAAFPLPSGDGHSAAHTAAAGVSFAALGAWPLLAGRPDGDGALRRTVSVTAGVVLLGLVGWFVVQLSADSDRVGLAERWAAGAQSVWPLVAAWSTSRLVRRRGGVT
jgi:hypothetical membrane protein